MGRRPSARKPSFMKILLEDFTKKLLIPAKFVGLGSRTLGRKCILRPTGTRNAWRVRTKLNNNSLYFKKGWKEFAQHHSLEYGDLLVFRCAKDCEFRVDIFDKSCCFKDPVTSQNVRPRKDSTTPIIPCQETKANPETPALEAAEEFISSSKFPAFIKIMQWAYVRVGGYMPLKADFGRMHLKDSTREAKIEVSGMTWTVALKKEGYPPYHRYKLNTQWGYLAMEYLKVGDICIFELINAEECTFRLSIFSSTREENLCRTKTRPGVALKPHSSQALEAANKFSSLSKYPSYPFAMHYHYMDARYLRVPRSFVNEMNATEGSNKVKLQCRGKEWDAVIDIHGICAKITDGWPSFAEQNVLYFGDACVLELINRKNALIRVTSFKCMN